MHYKFAIFNNLPLSQSNTIYLKVHIKAIPWNFTFLILKFFELFYREVCNFFKKQTNFWYMPLFLNVCKQIISRAHISKSKRYFNVKSSTYYFHMKTKILAYFQICISVPLIIHVTGDNCCWWKCWNTKKIGFQKNEKFRLKGAASSKKKWLLLNEKVSTTGNDFQGKQKLSLKGMASTTGNGFH